MEREPHSAVDPATTCSSEFTVTIELQPIFYSEIFDNPATINPFNETALLTVTDVPTTIILTSTVTRILNPTRVATITSRQHRASTPAYFSSASSATTTKPLLISSVNQPSRTPLSANATASISETSTPRTPQSSTGPEVFQFRVQVSVTLNLPFRKRDSDPYVGFVGSRAVLVPKWLAANFTAGGTSTIVDVTDENLIGSRDYNLGEPLQKTLLASDLDVTSWVLHGEKAFLPGSTFCLSSTGSIHVFPDDVTCSITMLLLSTGNFYLPRYQRSWWLTTLYIALSADLATSTILSPTVATVPELSTTTNSLIQDISTAPDSSTVDLRASSSTYSMNGSPTSTELSESSSWSTETISSLSSVGLSADTTHEMDTIPSTETHTPVRTATFLSTSDSAETPSAIQSSSTILTASSSEAVISGQITTIYFSEIASIDQTGTTMTTVATETSTESATDIQLVTTSTDR